MPKTYSCLRQAKVPLTLILLMPLTAPAAVGAVVQSCRGSDGALHFVQFSCPPETEPAAQDPAMTPINVVGGAALSAAEQRALAKLEQVLAKEREQRRRVRARAQTVQKKAKAREAEACRKAESALDALRIERRQGYRATEAQRLDAAERRWHAERRENC
ncbi:MAG: hypothetical protein AAGE43_00535 [Pseudomonadota bacterium]